MNWFYRWLNKKLVANDNMNTGLVKEACLSPTGRYSHRSPDRNGTHFILYPAMGGHILEVKMYDERTDTSNVALHIIPSDEDMGESIAKVITYEALRN